MSDRIQIIQGDALTVLRTLPSESVHCVVTSPPYWGLRDYGTAQWEGGDNGCNHVERLPSRGSSTLTSAGIGQTDEGAAYQAQKRQYRELCSKCGARRIDQQMGLERTPEEYVSKMVEVFREVRRVLREDGTAWVNMGDSYAANRSYQVIDNKHVDVGNNGSMEVPPGLKPKDLCGIPWRLAFALQAEGWWLRQDIIWSKPGPMPESVRDRCCKSHEYVFLLAKSERYFFDQEAIKEPAATEPHNSGYVNGAEYAVGPMDRGGHSQREDPDRVWAKTGTRIKRSVWTINSEAYPESHFATFPTALVKPCILAGTSARGCCPKCAAPWERVVKQGPVADGYTPGETPAFQVRRFASATGGFCRETKTTGWRPTCECHYPNSDGEPCIPQPCTVLDPFGGSGTVGQVALELGRNCILIELNPAYVELARKRTNVTPGLQLA